MAAYFDHTGLYSFDSLRSALELYSPAEGARLDDPYFKESGPESSYASPERSWPVPARYRGPFTSGRA